MSAALHGKRTRQKQSLPQSCIYKSHLLRPGRPEEMLFPVGREALGAAEENKEAVRTDGLLLCLGIST